jgi:hypothetical protein
MPHGDAPASMGIAISGAELNPSRIWGYPKKKGVYGPEGREVVGGGV